MHLNFILIFFFQYCLCHCQKNELKKDYLTEYPPPWKAESGLVEPFLVNLTFLIMSIPAIDELEQKIAIDTFYILNWRDERLEYNSTQLEPFSSDYKVFYGNKYPFWKPDLYITNLDHATSPKLLMETETYFVYPDGKVHYSKLVRFNFNCQMDFHMFPFDSQSCHMIVESWSYKNSQLKFNLNAQFINQKMILNQFYYSLEVGPESIATYTSG